MSLARAALGQSVIVEHVGGERSFRRRLMELGLVPGTRVTLVGLAPLGDPLELLVRGSSLSIRKSEAEQVRIAGVKSSASESQRPALASDDAMGDCAQSIP